MRTIALLTFQSCKKADKLPYERAPTKIPHRNRERGFHQSAYFRPCAFRRLGPQSWIRRRGLWMFLDEPIKQILKDTRELWDRDTTRPWVRATFNKMIECRTAALGGNCTHPKLRCDASITLARPDRARAAVTAGRFSGNRSNRRNYPTFPIPALFSPCPENSGLSLKKTATCCMTYQCWELRQYCNG